MFRIAQEDYARLSTVVSASGARSFSDFARSQVLRVLGEPSLADVGQRLRELELTIRQLTEALQRSNRSLGRKSFATENGRSETCPTACDWHLPQADKQNG